MDTADHQTLEISVDTLIDHLSINDIVEFATLPQQILSKKRFTITKIVSVQIENSWNHIFELSDSNQNILFSLDKYYGKMSISRKVELEHLHNAIFSPDKLQNTDFLEWIDKEYHEESLRVDSKMFYRDYRHNLAKNPDFIPPDHGKVFSYECFMGKSKNFLLDIEIFEERADSYMTVVLAAHEAIANICGMRRSNA